MSSLLLFTVFLEICAFCYHPALFVTLFLDPYPVIKIIGLAPSSLCVCFVVSSNVLKPPISLVGIIGSYFQIHSLRVGTVLFLKLCLWSFVL